MFYEKLSDKLSLPQEVRELMFSLQQKLGDLPELQDLLFANEYTTEKMEEQLKKLSEETETHEYTLSFYLLFISTKRLHEIYSEKGISEDIFFNTMMDLKYKLDECRALHGIWGTFVFGWFPEFYRLRRFGLGRLQYEIVTYEWEDYEKNGVSVKKGDTVYFCHIPSAGALTKELRMDSYRQASVFFGEKRLIVICESWILYPQQKDFLPPHSNILDFMNDFDIISSEDDEGFPDAWRVFGKDHTLSPQQWPQETSMQRAYAKRILSGKPTGNGAGIIIFDGEKIL